MNLQTFFADTVAVGWRPVNPCTDAAELARLEQSGIRGNCISPLLQEGDTIFIDRNAKPEPGDVVSFALSQRGADAQNTPPMPPGQTVGQWKKGDRWCKLLSVSHGYQMLLDRHGNSATATLMACESPDDIPVLHPVRQVVRRGRMLFGPSAPTAPMIPRRGVLLGALGGLALAGCDFGGVDIKELPPVDETSGAQIDANAATIVSTTTGSATLSVTSTYYTACSITVGPFQFATSVVCTASGSWQMVTGINADGAFITVYVSSSPGIGAGSTVVHDPTITYQAAGQTRVGGWAAEGTYALAANTTTTYNVYGIASYSWATSTPSLTGVTLKTEVIFR